MRKELKILQKLAMLGAGILMSVSALAYNLQIKNYEIRYYNPMKYGLKDLVYQVRILGLVDSLNREKIFGKLTDVYFMVYWIEKDQYKIEVFGLPKGFEERKKGLINELIKNKLDFVIPRGLSKKLMGYRFRTINAKGGYVVEGFDKSKLKAINRVQLRFDKEGRLRFLRTFSPLGVQISTFEMSAKPWSKNKWLIDEMKVETIQGGNKNIYDHQIFYKKIGSYGFPTQIKITSWREMYNPKNIAVTDKGSEPPQKTVYSFSNYEVNTGKARNKIIFKK